MANFLTYWHTLRHLKPVQLYGRVWFSLRRPGLDLAAAPKLRRADGLWRPPVERGQSLFAPFCFSFLREKHALDDVGWDAPQLGKLWRYNLHYFDDLNAQGWSSRERWHRELLCRWVAENPPAAGTGWEPYPTSLRMVNWIKWALAGNALPDECLQSLAVQARWLAGRLELHLQGNHLFANAKALAFAGLFFAGEEADAWLARGLRLLQRQLPEQILSDGGQFERSTMYHALALEDLLDLHNLAGAFPGALVEQRAQTQNWRAQLAPMRRWLAAMSHPDGEISLFNDAAFGIAPAPAELERYAGRLALPEPAALAQGVTRLAPSGYIRVQLGAMLALIDVAPVGPDYLPGHAHADILSFELSLFGERVLVNSGTSCYGTGPERSRQRGTAAHNTVIVDGADSSEVWGGFRVARRARPTGLALLLPEGEGAVEIVCSHDGYLRLPGKPVHTRSWRLSAGELTIEDRVSGGFALARARFHFAPPLMAGMVTFGNTGFCQLRDGHRLHWRVEQGHCSVEASSYHPRFGQRIANRCLVVDLERGVSRIHLYWD